MPAGFRMTAAHIRVAGVALAITLLAAIPTGWIAAAPSICLVKRLFGTECLGCGMTRAMSCLLHGDGAGALRYNPLAAVLLPLMGAVLLRDVLRLAGSRPGRMVK